MPASLVQIKIDGGIDESTSARGVQPPSTLTARNVVFPNPGEVAKRHGFTAIDTPPPNQIRALAYKNELLTTDGNTLYSYSETSGIWTDKGGMSPCIPVRSEVGAGSGEVGDVGEGNGYRIVAWIDGGSLYASVFDVATGASIYSGVTLSGSTNQPFNPRVVVANGQAVVFYGNGNVGGVYYRSISLTLISAGFQAEAITGATMEAAGLYDVCPVIGASTSQASFAIVTANPSVGKVFCNTYDAAMTHLLTKTCHTTGLGFTFASLAIRATWNESIDVAWSYGSITPNSYIYSSSLFPSTLVSLLSIGDAVLVWSLSSNVPAQALGIERVSSTEFLLVWNLGDGLAPLPGAQFYYTRRTHTGTQVFLSNVTNWLQCGSKPFARTTAGAQHIYMVGFWTDPVNSTQFLLEIPQVSTDRPRIVATMAPRYSAKIVLGGALQVQPAARCSSVTFPGDLTQSKYTTIVYSLSAFNTVSVNTVTFDFKHPAIGQFVPVGDSIMIAGGLPMLYDGNKTTEAGFTTPPPVTSSNLVPEFGFGGSLPDGTYRYMVVYAQEDFRGQTHRSAPSPASTVLVARGGATSARVVVNVPPLQLTYRQGLTVSGQNPVTIEVYRTTGTLGSTFYRIGTMANDRTGTMLQFVDSWADSGDTTLPVIYTTGGVLESQCPSALSFLCMHNGRIYGVSDDARTLYATTSYVPGEVPRFNDALQLPMPDGPINALWSLNGVLWCASSTAIYAQQGDGPADTGVGSDWQQPQTTPFDMGCIEPRSVCTSQLGVTFQSRKGLYLMTRGGDLEWIGQRVQNTLAANPVITAAAIQDTDGAIAFSLKTVDSSGQSGLIARFDYRHGKWSTWDVSSPVTGGNAGIADMVIANGLLCLLGDKGASEVLRWDTSTYLDGSAWVTMAVQTPHLELFGEQTFGRVNRVEFLAQRASSHGLNIRCVRNYSVNDPTISISAAAIDAWTAGEQVRVTPKTEKCESMSVVLSDSVGTGGTGQGAVWNGLQFKVRTKGSEWRLPAGQNK